MELTTFDFNDNEIRIVEIDGEPWFLAADVCNALGLTNVAAATSQNLTNREVQNFRIPGTRGRPNKLISESGLYKVLFQSRKPEARAFQDWVTQVVLPAIRKDGGYVAGEEKLATGEMSEEEFVLKAMTMLKAKADRLQKHVSDHLEYMSVDAFFALKHIYPAKGDSTSLGRRASLICARDGLTKRKHRRYAPSIEMMVELGEYPVAVLEEAFEDMINAGRIPRNLPQKELGLVH
mgnify:CR=1 FL=1